VNEAEALFDDNEFELLITDVMIPQGSGHALARSLVARRPDLRVLFVSGYSGAAPVEGLSSEQVRFLTKPFGSSELAETIEELLPPES
jgi:two-component system, cell cycle sensor histidine kinase and response regulator CckA